MNSEGEEQAAPRGFDRFCLIALRAGLALIALFVVYFWMVRLGGDLNVDEAFNFRTYARNPLTAIGLYHEPNNHPLESLVKSLFFAVPGLNQPAFYRVSGFLVVLVYLGVGWAAWRRLSREGSIVTATVLVLTMLLTTAYNVRATRLRGYFLSSVLQLVYLCVLSKDAGLLRPRGEDSARPWSRGTAIKYGALSALVVFTVPSNLFAIPCLWLFTIAAFPAAGPALGAWFRRVLVLATLSAVFAAILYAPIFLSLALGASSFHQLEPGKTTVREDLAILVDHLTPRGVPPAVFGWVLGAFLLVALVRNWKSRTTRLAAAAIALSLAIRLPVGVIIGLPERARPTFIPAVSFALLLMLHDLVSGWSRRSQVHAALVLVLASFGAIPALVEEDRFYRDPTEATAFLQMLGGEDWKSALIVHDRMLDPIYPLQQVFGRDRIVSGRRELLERVSGVSEDPLDEGSWKKKLRELIIPRDRFPKLDLAGVRYLVVIDDVRKDAKKETNPSQWIRPELDDLLSRLTRRSEYAKYDLRIKIFQAP